MTSEMSPARRILFFDDRHYAAQGAQKLLVQLASFASDVGLDVTVASTKEGAFLDLARSRGLPTLSVGVPAELDKFEGALMSGGRASKVRVVRALLRQNRRLRRVVRDGNYDVVWAAAVRPMLSLLMTSFLTKTPVVWQIMGSGYFRGLSEIASLAARRIVVIAHGLTSTAGMLHRFPMVNRRIRVVQTGLPLPTELSSTRRLVVEELDLPPEVIDLVWVVSIGAHIEEKGHLDVLRAAEALPNETRDQVFVLMGGPPIEGNYHDRLTAAAQGSKVQSLVTGWVGDVDVWLRAADVYVVASTREGMPLTLIEAMQRGVAPIGYPVGGVPELIQDGRTGLLVDQGSVSGLTGALDRLIVDPEAAHLMAGNAQQFVMTNNTDVAMRAKFTAVLHELIPELKEIS